MEVIDGTGAMLFDSMALQHGGMSATNGHSLYKSREVIMDCLAKLLECRNTSHPVITVADIGTADGSTSLSLINDIIDKIRMHPGPSHQVMIYYTDLPGNDFNRLFTVTHGKRDKAGLNLGPDVYSAVVGRTMYEQCLPDASADLIFSSIAAHHLSKSPCRFEDGVSSIAASEKELEVYASQNALDWKTFLIMRGRELRPGGYLVVLTVGATKDGEVSIHIKGGIATLGHVLKTLLADNLITKEEFMDCNTCYEQYRTEADHALPFTDNDKDLLETGLELVSTRSFVNKLNHPSFEISNKDDTTRKVYADRIIAGIKPWFYGAIYKGLSGNRSQQEREYLSEKYFARLWEFAYKNDDQIPQLALVEVVARKRI